MPSERWADPRAKLLHGPAWEAARPGGCRALNHALDPTVELTVLGHQLAAAYRRTAAHLAANPDVRVERRRAGTRWCSRPWTSSTSRPACAGCAPSSMTGCRASSPELLLEIHGATGFADEFTHVSEPSARVEDLATSVCAVLLAEACNVGLTALSYAAVGGPNQVVSASGSPR